MFEWCTPEPERPVLDPGYLARLARHVGGTVLAELMADGLIELSDRMTRLEELAAAGDLEGIARLGHDLVGMAGHLGLARLSAAAAAMNRAAREGSAERAALAAGEVRRLGLDAAGAMRRYMDENSAL